MFNKRLKKRRVQILMYFRRHPLATSMAIGEDFVNLIMTLTAKKDGGAPHFPQRPAWSAGVTAG